LEGCCGRSHCLYTGVPRCIGEWKENLERSRNIPCRPVGLVACFVYAHELVWGGGCNNSTPTAICSVLAASVTSPTPRRQIVPKPLHGRSEAVSCLNRASEVVICWRLRKTSHKITSRVAGYNDSSAIQEIHPKVCEKLWPVRRPSRRWED
jgi:hypothetical protein